MAETKPDHFLFRVLRRFQELGPSEPVELELPVPAGSQRHCISAAITRHVLSECQHIGVENLYGAFASAEQADTEALAWLAKIDPAEKVGTRHHTVPRFYLARFSDRHGQLVVRDRSTGSASTRNVLDMGIKDFYTFVHVEGHLDSSFEQILQVFEDRAALVVTKLMGSFSAPAALSLTDRVWLDTFVAYQFIRGAKVRRSLELMADYASKLTHQSELSAEQIEHYEFAPHQNEHMRMFDKLAGHAFDCLRDRPLSVLTLDQPLFFIGDEPVVTSKPDGFRPPTPEELLTHPRVAEGSTIAREDLILTQGHNGAGLETAEEVLLPISPRSVLVYGHRRDCEGGSWHRVAGEAAVTAAEEVNGLILENAIDWVAAHPNHPTFRTMDMPEPTPIITIIDGGTVMGRQAREANRRRPRRLPKAEPAIG